MLEKEQAANRYLMNILLKLKQFKDNDKLCDISLSVNYKQFKAHKAILAAWSPIFANKLLSLNEDRVNLVLNYDEVEMFSEVLDYLYSGCIGPEESNVRSFLDIGKNLMIDPLVNICEDFLKTTTSLGNFVSRYFTSLKYGLTSLEKYIVSFVETNIIFVIEQEPLLHLPPQDLKCFLTMGKMAKAKQEIKFTIIINWIGYNIAERDKYMLYLAKNLQWNSSVKDLLIQLTTVENVLTRNEFCLFQLLYSITHSTGHNLGPFTTSYPRLYSLYSHMLEELKGQDKYLISSIEVNMFNAIPIKVEKVPFRELSSTETRDAEVNTDVDSSYFSEEMDSSMIDSSRPVKTENVSDSLNTPINDYEEETDNSGNLVSSIEIDDVSSFPAEPVEDIISEDETFRKTSSVEQTAISKISKSKKAVIKKVKSKKLPKKEKNTVSKSEDKEIDQQDFSQDQESDNGANTDDYDVVNFDIGHDIKLKATVKVEVENIKGVNGKRRKSLLKSGVRKRNQYIKRRVHPEKVQHENALEFKPERKQKFKCTFEGCQFRSRTEAGLSKHIDCSHSVDVRLDCKKCEYSTTQMRLLCIHMKDHYQKQPYICEEPGCSRKFLRMGLFIRHQMTHTNEKPYKCDLCSKTFGTFSELSCHKKLHEGRQFECDVCYKRFTTKGSMQSHRAIHFDNKPYLCDTCGFSTKHLSHLISHRKTHSGDVLHCSFPNCNYTTPKQGHMTQHINTHLNIRNHICQVCGKSFVVRGKLLRHEKIHLKEKLYKCKQCDYRTSRTDRMKLHIESHGIKFKKKLYNLPSVEDQKPEIDYHQLYERVQSMDQSTDASNSNGFKIGVSSMSDMKMDAISLAASASMIVDSFSTVRLDQIGSASVASLEEMQAAAFHTYDEDDVLS